jgi:hypothetical protein
VKIVEDAIASVVLGSTMVKGKAVPVTGHEGPQGCERSRLTHILESWLIDGGEVVSLTRRPPFAPRKFLLLISVRG